MVKLNLGCGTEEILPGYINVDIRKLEGVDVVDDIVHLSHFISCYADEIRASHCIEHLSHENVLLAVKNWFRVLKVGGILQVYCPNARLIAEDYVNNIIEIRGFSRLLFGNQTYDENLHRLAFDYGRLCTIMKGAGFEIIGSDKRPNAYKYELGVKCRKPAQESSV